MNFNCVICIGGQYLIYVGEQCGGVYVSVVSYVNNCFGKGFREFVGWYKCVVIYFYVYYQCVQIFCKFFCQNRGGDQWDGVYGCGNIMGCVEMFISWSQ